MIDGPAASQTVAHAHIHVIPRWHGDVPDPLGRHPLGPARHGAVLGMSGAIAFAERLLALLDDGSFTATYKYAVLLALTDLCLEHTSATGEAPSVLTTRQLAGKAAGGGVPGRREAPRPAPEPRRPGRDSELHHDPLAPLPWHPRRGPGRVRATAA